ncbi:MAG: Flagellar hook-basal body complex protein FliE [Alphaproteobacteria bacterium MarineAlpha9_Bin4]|nr:flagellar hook-basal body complex protein FliE [Pelagibacterales bacterium]PPR26880.1 MAG: Flagellar hook-basal body complex protein FliE [Alphaproteobacteria bacterium MarineAlpha9_Bin4]|tara:strand:+ start:209 stop:565 length:357 start_codon:yes stop_codon:yes gene_type:complete
MNKINSTGLNLISRANENKINEELVSKKEILSEQNSVLKNNNLLNENNFLQNVSDAINNVAKTQNEAAKITKNYELGNEQDLTKVIVNQQISKLAFQITLNVRNKVLSAYKDIMNMPV